MEQNNKLTTAEEQHTAMDKVAGFTYQFFCFLYHLLSMKPGEVVSFEKWDDATVEKGNLVTMYQSKHTVRVGADDKAVKLTNRASDLWKAIDVWRDLTVGGNDNKRTQEEMLDYIYNHEFVFVSNKVIGDNKVVKLCDELRNNAEDKHIEEVLDEITNEGRLGTDTGNKDGRTQYRSVQMMIDELKSFDLREQFLKKVTFESKSQDDIKKDCVDYITDYVRFSEEDAEKVFEDFFAEAVKDLFDRADSGKPLQYTFEEQKKRFERVFQYHREEDLNFQIQMEGYKKEFLDLVCIQQLIKVRDFAASDTVEVAKNASYFYSFKNRYAELIEQSKILEHEDEEFRADAISYWENEFKRAYKKLKDDATEDGIVEKAQDLLYEVRKHELKLRKKWLGLAISNGAYYYLTDECLIGWHRDWKEFFKKKYYKDG